MPRIPRSPRGGGEEETESLIGVEEGKSREALIAKEHTFAFPQRCKRLKPGTQAAKNRAQCSQAFAQTRREMPATPAALSHGAEL
jgi:hypothetical protein